MSAIINAKAIPRTYLHVDPDIFKILYVEAKKRQIPVNELMLEILENEAGKIKAKKGK
ncbi:TPA: hypothetical protein ACIIUJ_003938 [Klebsiella aerogenes]|uniref:hypothetical protein n=1 Tax=Klebsiella aerogenes TaxID=548 RepID=UPI0018C85122|nr:hypothetical protein [Klebsiella aerogenes]MBG1888723.1 hypothetical protein [Klebsiella aerogenes]MBQ0679662.1 hypothetical protein [Klebsiella aerogenes]HCR0152697.1 hypothetical protein [Klebsiella aerogenes]HDS8023525.1 hypothetical protein [Klebsiella aerogenes]